jgi:drug/metabolite transporter (DMT)-like permease
MSGGNFRKERLVSRRGWVLFAAMSVIWGLPYLLIKVADGGVSVPVLVLARVSLGALLLLPFALRRRQFAAIRPVWPWLLAFAVVEIIMPWFALSEAERGISSSLTGLLIASVPVIVAVISLFLAGGDRLSPVRWIGLLIGLGGVALLAGPHLVGSSGGGAARSVGEVLFVALCYATGPLIANRKLADVPPVAMTAACLILASVVYAPLAAFSWPSAVPSASVLASMAGLAVVCTAAAFLIFFKLISEVGPARASVITYINPAIAVTLGVAVLGEHVSATMLVAFGTILVGSVLATRPARRSGTEAAASPSLHDHGRVSADAPRDIRDHEKDAMGAALDSPR